MNTLTKVKFRLLIAGIAFLLIPGNLLAWEPNANDLESAIREGDFTKYYRNLSTWLNQKVPADSRGMSGTALKALLKDPAVAGALAQRQFLAKVGPDKLGTFARTDEANKPFLIWLLKNKQALDLYLEGATPVKLAAREDNSWSISVGALQIWKKIYYADPDSRQGIYLRLAMATSLRPPGTGAPGSGQQKTPSDPVVRYKYFKTAHANQELFPSFDKLTVWDYQFVVSSGASEADLTWGREMINTWNPNIRKNEKVVDTTSMVWRRNSPIHHTDFKAVLDGGGKCGPRSSWAVFICQAFGIPAIGVGQPRHACVAYKSVDGSWQVAYGKGWNASRLEGMSGPEFVAGVESRSFAQAFSQVEHLRWLATVLSSKEQASAVMRVAVAIAKSTPTIKRNLDASEKADEMDADPGAAVAAKTGPANARTTAKLVIKAEPPIQVMPGVIHFEGTDFAETGGITVWGGEPRITVLDSYTGGKQLLFQQGMASCWVGYKVNVPETGVYEMVAKVATVNSGQSLYVRSFGAMVPVKQAKASSVWKGKVKDLGPQMAVDNNPNTRWAANFGVDKAWIELDLGQPTPISTVMIDERAYEKVSKFRLEYKVGDEWKTILEGTTLGNGYAKDFPRVTAQYVRLSTLDCSGATGGPTFWEFGVGTVQDGHAWISLPWTAGLWQTTKPVDVRLIKGSQMVWIFAPYQRGVGFKSFDMKLKDTRGAL